MYDVAPVPKYHLPSERRMVLHGGSWWIMVGLSAEVFFGFFFSRVSAKKIFWCFFVFFGVFVLFWGCFCVFLCVFFVFCALARKIFVFFRRWNEKKREFPF